MKHRKWVCIIVDAYSTGRYLAQAFKTHGFNSVHIQTLSELSNLQKSEFRSDDFLENIKYQGDPKQVFTYLKQKYPDIKCIVPGIESGVILADYLSDLLNVRTNGTKLSTARRDKYSMFETVKSSGLSVIPQIKSNDINRICGWVAQRKFDDLVIKPLSSSGSHGFNICKNDQSEIKNVFEKLYNSRDVFGDVINEVIVQPLVNGQEYAVNFVSLDGEHYLTDIWKTDKRRIGRSKVYDKELLIYFDDPQFQKLSKYTKRVLTALGIFNGPSHTEVMLTDDGNVVLIETAARLMGAIDISQIAEALGHNAVQLTAEAYITPERFRQRLRSEMPNIKKYACMVQMLSTSTGILEKICLDKIEALESYHGVDILVDSNDRISVTIDSYTSPGLIFLSNKDEGMLHADYKYIREMERLNQLFIIN